MGEATRRRALLLGGALLISTGAACSSPEEGEVPSVGPPGPTTLEPPEPEGEEPGSEAQPEPEPQDAQGGVRGGDTQVLSGSEDLGIPWILIEANPADLVELNDKVEEDEAIEIEVSVSIDGESWEGVRMELHGGLSRTFPKKSYRLTFPDDHKWETDLFSGDEGEPHRRVVLQASWVDATWMRNKLTMDAILAAGGLAPRVEHVVVALNGTFHGLYQAIERVDRVYLGRVGLSKEGSVYKAVNHNANWNDKPDPLKGYEKKLNEDLPHEDLAELLEALSDTPKTEADFAAEVEPRLALQDFLAWQAVHTLAMNRDTFTKNYYLHHDQAATPGTPADRFRIITWDADATWALNWNGEPLEADQGSWHGTDAFSPRLFAIDTWRQAYRDLYLGLLSGPLDKATLEDWVDAGAELLEVAALADLVAWERDEGFAEEMARLREAVGTRHEVMEAIVEGL